MKKSKKLLLISHEKNEYHIHIRSLKQKLNNGLVLKKVHRVIKFNKKSWVKSYIDMNTNLRIKATNDYRKDFFKLINNLVFSKIMKNVRKLREIELKITEARRNYLMSEPNYHVTKFFKKIYYQ